MRVFRFNLPREKLDAVAEEERTLFLLLGHFSNQAAILGRWVCWCAKEAEVSEVERKGRFAQIIMTLTLFAAKLNEGWELLQKQYFASKLSKTYAPLLPNDATDALQELGKYFGADNAVRRCRNEYAFHYAPDILNAHYSSIPKEEETEIYLSEAVGFNLFHIAEMAAAHSLFTKLGNGDRQAGMLRLMEESLKVSAWFQSFVGGFMPVFLDRLGVVEHSEEKIGDPPKFNSLEIPFLAEM